tara:strand:- start:6862 stop:7698 length:837 start_codon:yes stop_codon:yes gene_type:complete
MSFIPKAIWYLEIHFNERVRLDDLAAVAGVSRYHLSRAFGYATGYTISRYLRSRRLSEGAKLLAADQVDVMSVALRVGYQSHEAFSRAFKEEFGISPSEVYGCRNHSLTLTEALTMNDLPSAKTLQPQIIEKEAMLMAGHVRHYNELGNAAIPGQWQDFLPHLGQVPNQVGGDAFGAVFNIDSENNFDYLSGVEVDSYVGLPDDYGRLRLPQQIYAVFQHESHVSELKQTCQFAFAEWIPNSDFKLVDGPFFERYLPEFNSETGYGGLEVWIPVARTS